MNTNYFSEQTITDRFTLACQAYRVCGVSAEDALERLATVPVSIHCWQGDDVRGFENPAGGVSGGIIATGNYPGPARTGDQLRADMLAAFGLIPGVKRANIHALYAEPEQRVERDQLLPEHFAHWMSWSADNGIALDFNPTFFSHPLAADGYTLSHPDPQVREYWIRHGRACRRIAQAFALNQDAPSIVNFWIPDGSKEIPADRRAFRARLLASYDTLFSSDDSIDSALCLDAVESKLFGIGSESFVAGSHEFYLGYCLTRGIMPCLDMGHFHPTEAVDDKISALLPFCDRLLLHVSRGVRWDSDHVVLLDDAVRRVCQEVVRNDALNRVMIALDYFDASINRIAAWVIGARSVQKALLYALLEPVDKLRALEEERDGAGTLALQEVLKTMPFGAVWDYYCRQQNVPLEGAWMEQVYAYERDELSKRIK